MKRARSRSLTRRLAIYASTVALMAGLAVVGAAGSASAATCFGYSCHGHDPEIYGCSATTTETVPVTANGVRIATLWNRYSSGCKANWARAQLTTAGINAHDTFWIDAYTTDSQGHKEFMCYPGPDNSGLLIETPDCNVPPYGGSEILYTDMVDGTNLATADIWVFDSSGYPLVHASASQ